MSFFAHLSPLSSLSLPLHLALHGLNNHPRTTSIPLLKGTARLSLCFLLKPYFGEKGAASVWSEETNKKKSFEVDSHNDERQKKCFMSSCLPSLGILVAL